MFTFSVDSAEQSSPLEIRAEAASDALVEAASVVGTLNQEITTQNGELERLIEERTKNENLASLSEEQASAILAELEQQNRSGFRTSLLVTAGSVVASGLLGWFLNEATSVWRYRRSAKKIALKEDPKVESAADPA